MPSRSHRRRSDQGSESSASGTQSVARAGDQDLRGNAAVQMDLGLARRGEGGGAPMVPRGGYPYTIRRGDTLWHIAERTYGSGEHWPAIMSVNPGTVQRDGDLILVGDTLNLPIIAVESTAGDQAPPGSGGTGGACVPAVAPRSVCTEYGDFTVFPDACVGELPWTTDGSQAIRESEYCSLIAELEAAATAERERSVSEVNDLLSYGAFDWAITDAEATRALALLGGLPMSQLRRAVRQINISRLLDNVPSEQRQTAAFSKVVVALGPDSVGPYIQELLSYGLFDWAITDAEIREIVQIISLLAPSQQLSTLEGLGANFLARFVEQLPSDHGMSHDQLKQLFDTIGDSDLGALKQVFSVRFNLTVEGRDGGAWDAPGLRQAWVILAQLPPEHVADNDALALLVRDDAQAGSGYYRSSDESAVIGYGWLDNDDVGADGHGQRDADGSEDQGLDVLGGYGQYEGVDAIGNPVMVDLHANVNLFNTVLRHEIGHAVDADIGASDPGGYVYTAENAGRWEEYAGCDAFVNAVIAAGGAMSQYADLHPEAPAAYDRALRKAAEENKDFNDALQELRDSGDADAAVPDAPASIGGPVGALLVLDNWHPSKSPWYGSHGRAALNDRIFQRAYDDGRFVSYSHQAKLRHGVSAYQWRAPGEWFAEAYACYYSDNDSADGTPMGTRLRTRDSRSADWFDRIVDKGHSLQAETGGPPGAENTSNGSES